MIIVQPWNKRICGIIMREELISYAIIMKLNEEGYLK